MNFRGVIIALSLTTMIVCVVLFCMSLTTYGNSLLMIVSLCGVLVFTAILVFAVCNKLDE